MFGKAFLLNVDNSPGSGARIEQRNKAQRIEGKGGRGEVFAFQVLLVLI